MGRKAEFTEEQIIKYGKAIEAEGGTVSPFAIRNRLKGGDSRRIAKVWLAYKSNQKIENTKDESNEEIELPTEIEEALNKNIKISTTQLERLAMESYKAAKQVANKEVRITLEELNEKINEYQESENQASLALEDCDLMVEKLEDEIELLSKRNEQLMAENSRVSGQLESTQRRTEQLEKIEEAYNSLQREFGKLEGQLELLSKK